MIYCLDVKTFYDGNGDGIGNFQGLAERLEHLVDLGVTVIWLMPFYPTADVDDGYDITDFYGVDPRLGTLGDFVEFMRTARSKGLKVIADLVVNHTSARHPWFRSARRSPDSPYRDWYVWRDRPGPEKPGDVVFPDAERSIWTKDRAAGQYYLHRFYRSQPDLNVANPRVRDEIGRIVGFWMELGLSGFRVDAVPFLLDTDGLAEAKAALPEPHEYARDLRLFLNRRCGDAVLLGEVNLTHDLSRRFFGDEDGDELTMLFDFPTMQAMSSRSPGRRPGRSVRPCSAVRRPQGLAGGRVRPPRRADPGQAQRCRATEGLRRVRTGAGHATLRSGSAPTPAVDARR